MTADIHMAHKKRTFLVVVDESEELSQALYYACRRAENNDGDVALLFVLDPVEFQHWSSVGDLMRAEQMEAAEGKTRAFADLVTERLGRPPKIFIRDGESIDQVLAVMDEEPSITALVLGASTGKEGPGPLVQKLTGQLVGRVKVPLIVIPGTLTEEEILQIT